MSVAETVYVLAPADNGDATLFNGFVAPIFPELSLQE